MASFYVTDPLLNELKGYTRKLLQYYYNHEHVTDTNPILLDLEGCLENIFYCGIKGKTSLFGYIWEGSPWRWMEKTKQSKDFFDERSRFTRVIECVNERKDICTPEGRFRFAVRACLEKKCLQVPVEHLMATMEYNKYYVIDAIFCDEILLQILLSVIYQLNKVDFKLDLDNTCMMDLSWELPSVIRVELVPTKDLGITVEFVRNKAVIRELKPHSIAFDCEEINVGDIIESLNSAPMTESTRLGISSLIRKGKCEPVVLTIIQAIPDRFNSSRICPAMEKLYKELRMDVTTVRDSHMRRVPSADSPVPNSWRAINGFQVAQLGSVRLEQDTDAASVDKAFSLFMRATTAGGLLGAAAVPGAGSVKRTRRDVLLEVGELSIKCTHLQTKALIAQHLFMEISACSSVTLMPNYFAYIAGKGDSKLRQNFRCYFFIAPNPRIAMIILKLIRHGFGRTYYAV